MTLTADETCTQGAVVAGTLLIGSGVIFTASRVDVLPNGTFQIGTADAPARDVTVVLTHANCDTAADPVLAVDEDLLAQCLAHGELVSKGRLLVYGEPKTTWTQLTAGEGARQVTHTRVTINHPTVMRAAAFTRSFFNPSHETKPNVRPVRINEPQCMTCASIQPASSRVESNE